LVATIVRDVEAQPGALPLLQYALTELFERRDGRGLTRAAYQASGGVTGALARRADLHPRRRAADAGGGEDPLALDLDHAGATIAVGPIAGFGAVAEMRDLDALAMGDLPDRLTRLRRDLDAVEGEGDGVANGSPLRR